MMFPNSSKELKYLDISQVKPPNSKTESTFNNINEKRDSPNDIINFINKKFCFKSKFDKKGSDKFLSSKDLALCDVLLNDEIEENENEYNDLVFMQNFTFNEENNLINDEKIRNIKIPKCYPLNHSLFELNKLNNNYYNTNKIEKNKAKFGNNKNFCKISINNCK